MNIIDRLRTDHLRFMAMMEALERSIKVALDDYGSKNGSLRAIMDSIHELLAEIKAHEDVERRVFFPAVRKASPDLEAALHGLDAEHDEIDAMARGFEHAPAKREGSRWLLLKALRLNELLRHHIMHEDAEILTQADRYIPAADLESMGRMAGKPRH